MRRAALILILAAILCPAPALARPAAAAPRPRRTTSEQPLLSAAFQRALRFAVQVHNRQLRKGTGEPYVSHLLQVAGLVMENGGNEKAAIAALLHDAVEDQGGSRMLRRIERRFGADIAKTVSEVTEVPDAPWRTRKETTIRHVAEGSLSSPALLIKLADNVHNARSMVDQQRRDGASFWGNFSGGRQGTLWYFRSMLRAYDKAGVQSPLRDDLARAVRQLTRAR
jgi:(p)ppGpp synthase/HD superfamily hydrolase